MNAGGGSRARESPPRIVPGRRAALEAVRSGRATRIRVAASAQTSPGLRELLETARAAGIPVSRVDRRALDALAEGHQGVVADLAAGRTELTERELAHFPFEDDALAVVLDGVTDPQNLGAAARSAEAAGAAMLVTRVRRAAGPTRAAVVASAGALLHLPHARVANLARAIGRLQAGGFFVVGLDDSARASIYDEPCPDGRVALVVGSEGRGMSRLVREACDGLVRLPMRGRVDSLNASASLAAALYAYVLPSRGG